MGCTPIPAKSTLRTGRPAPLGSRGFSALVVCPHRRDRRPVIRPVRAAATVSPSVEAAIQSSIGRCLTETSLSVGKQTVGKVRDTYDCGSHIVIVTSDRQSAFDRLLASVPYKGQVLNQTSAWWMQHTSHITPNALLAVPDPNIAIMKKCQVLPIEFVVRGFMTGSTDTSLWTHYNAGERTYCGNTFPDGMRKNDKLQQQVITPTTKSASHDVPISGQDILDQGILSQSDWDQASKAALALFKFGQQEAAERGLLLVDTKYEFGKDTEGNIMLIDEIHTPDSSRYWIQDTYDARHAEHKEPESIDKEFLRLWFRERCDPYADKELPEAPNDLVAELSRRYIYLYEQITGEQFQPVSSIHDPQERMEAAVQAALQDLTKM